SQGRTVSFKDTVLIMTSNAWTGVKKANIGFTQGEEETDTHVTEQLSDTFRPEFLNRFDGVIAFRSLTRENLLQIVDLMLDDVREAACEQGLTLSVTEAAKHKLVDLGFDPAFGARPLRRVISEQVEDGIADRMLEEEDVTQLTVDVTDDQITVVKNR